VLLCKQTFPIGYNASIHHASRNITKPGYLERFRSVVKGVECLPLRLAELSRQARA
jgi:hypothetical protein